MPDSTSGRASLGSASGAGACAGTCPRARAPSGGLRAVLLHILTMTRLPRSRRARDPDRGRDPWDRTSHREEPGDSDAWSSILREPPGRRAGDGPHAATAHPIEDGPSVVSGHRYTLAETCNATIRHADRSKEVDYPYVTIMDESLTRNAIWGTHIEILDLHAASATAHIGAGGIGVHEGGGVTLPRRRIPIRKHAAKGGPAE